MSYSAPLVHQYYARVLRPDGTVQECLFLAHPNEEPEGAACEFSTNWAAQALPPCAPEWPVLSVTDCSRQVSYIPAQYFLADGRLMTYFFRHDYQVPGRYDNPRYFLATLVHREQPGRTRRDVVVITRSDCSPQLVAEEFRRQWKKGEWKYQRQPLQELTRESYHLLRHQLLQDAPRYLAGS
ncbi:hypothetical protein [Hymenobacter jeollabukensis]|uniref:Uncharacterized protein n=1 Tax=Hymenobacter jeollabukensis TaxID=2025313 RepID=A0A5R8WIK3_9BACT|nr:hypothetical protein [Hymenobacter jeollabukensis]TLM88706.1 hypothetical protein FDY95_23000 [Hymenobacter jeollabukensis]